jgi:hypothetical protein
MKISILGMTLCAAGALSFAHTWDGARVLDASCYDQNVKSSSSTRTHISRMCAPTASTSAFAFKSTSGRVYRMDALGNDKAEKALESGALKRDSYGAYKATVIGHRQGDSVIVSQITHGSHSVH